MARFAFIAIFVSQRLLLLAICQGDAVYQSENITNSTSVVLLGGLFPVHNTVIGNVLCGGLAENSVQRVESMAYAVSTINRRTDLLPNVTLAFSIRDTCASPRYGLDQAFHYVQARRTDEACRDSSTSVSISGLVGAQFSRVSLDIANLLRLYQIPQISYISTADELGDKTRFDYFFRTIPPDSLQARAIADIIMQFNWTFVYALFSNDAYGKGGIQALVENLAMNNRYCIAELIPLPVLDVPEADFYAAVVAMSQNFVRNATVAVIFGQLETAIGVMRAMRKARENGIQGLDNMTWIGTDTWGDSLPEEYRSDAGGIISVLPRAVRDPAFDDYFVNLTPQNTSDIWFDELWEKTFTCNVSNDSCVVKNMLSRATHVQASQITLVTDAVYAFAHAIHRLVERECSNGALCDKIMENRMLGRAIKGELLREELYNISFLGPSMNNVSFDRNEEKGSFYIKNMQRNAVSNKYTFEIVGSWDGELKLTAPIQWVTGDVPKSICSEPCGEGYQPVFEAERRCCWSCMACTGSTVSDGLSCQACNASEMPNPNGSACIRIPISFLQISHSWPIALLTLSTIGLIATISVILLFLVCYKHKIVKASSREVSGILLAGLVLCYTMPFFFADTPSPPMCAIRRFGVGFSFAICFSALLVKTNRIYRIFNQKALDPTRPPRFTSPLSQVVMTLLLILVQAVIATIWLAVDRPSTIVTYGSRAAELVCGESPIIYLIVSLCYNLILLILSTIYAFLARKVPSNYNEAKYINVTLYTLFIIWLAFIPIYSSTLQFGSLFQTTSFMIAIILSASTTLVCIFMPKIYIIVKLRIKDQSAEGNSTFVTTRKDSNINKS